jgi:hypothetical protein
MVNGGNLGLPQGFGGFGRYHRLSVQFRGVGVECSTGDTTGPIGNTTHVTCETIPVCILVLTGTGYNYR